MSDLNSLPDCITEALAIFGHVDILIHNGGISNRGDIISTDVNVAVKVMMVNYFGQMVLTKGKFLKQPYIFYFVNMHSNCLLIAYFILI